MIKEKELTVKRFLELRYFFDPYYNYNCSGLFSMIHPKNFIKETLYKKDSENKDVSLIIKQISLVEAKFEKGVATISEIFVGVITDFDDYSLEIVSVEDFKWAG